MLTLAAFVLALAILIAVHEYGHYRMAVACGVKVIRFSIGFGKVLLRWQPKGSSTEFAICALPVGGYVKMLDEREAPVPLSEQHLAFNTQPLRSRVAIVMAGPVSNLLLAVFLYAVVNWTGVQYPAAILARPDIGSIAERAGLVGGERVQRVGFDGEVLQTVTSFEDMRWFVTQGALDGHDVRLQVSSSATHGVHSEVLLKLSSMDASEANAELFQKVGIVGPYSRPVVGEVVAGSIADHAGLRDGDVVLAVGLVPVIDAQQLRQLIRMSVVNGEATSAIWKITRAGVLHEISVKPESRQEGGLVVGKIGAYIGAIPELVLVKYGAIEGLWRGATHTWDVSILTLKMMGKILIGESSLKNLSGPLTIADYAGKSASMGLTQYLLFLALISVSLGVLNLLPLPVLDGGHLMYYLWEGLTGRPVSDLWLERMQRGGVAILMLMMAIAFFNDITRLLG